MLGASVCQPLPVYDVRYTIKESVYVNLTCV